MKKIHLSKIILAFTLAFTTISTISAMHASAKKTISIDSKVSGSITKMNNKREYSFVVTEAGKLTFTAESKVNVRMRVYDGSGKSIFSEIQLQGTATNAATHKKTVYLEKGTYYVDVLGDNSSEGTFSVKPTFTSVNSTERESNNTLDLAQIVVDGSKVNGTFTYTDSIDMYRLEMIKPGSMSLGLDAYMNMDMEIVNSDKEVIVERHSIKGQDSKASNYQYPLLLEADVYYIKLYANDDTTGKYKLNVKTELFDYAESINNNIKENAQLLENNKILMGSILNGDSTDWYMIDVAKPTKWQLTYDGDQFVKIGLYSDETLPLDEYDGYKSLNRTIYLSKGEYYVKIDRKSTEQGLYKLKSTLTTVASDEGVYNDTPQYAETLSIGQSKKGILSLVDIADVYAVPVTKSGYLTMNISTNTTAQLAAQNEQGYTQLNAQYAYGTAAKNASTTATIKVNPGTYYWFVKKQPYATGQYTVKASFSTSKPVAKPTLSSVTTPKAGAKKVTGKATKGSIVTVKIGSKSYKATANTSGKFTITVPKLKKGAKLIVTAKNSAGTSAKKTVTVKK